MSWAIVFPVPYSKDLGTTQLYSLVPKSISKEESLLLVNTKGCGHRGFMHTYHPLAGQAGTVPSAAM